MHDQTTRTKMRTDTIASFGHLVGLMSEDGVVVNVGGTG